MSTLKHFQVERTRVTLSKNNGSKGWDSKPDAFRRYLLEKVLNCHM